MNYKRIKSKIDVGSLVTSILAEINQQCIPLFKIWETRSDSEYIVTFNSIRIITPLIELASRIEFPDKPEDLFDKLGVPNAKISWFIFRHGLSHSIRPFIAEEDGITYKWGIKQYKGNHHVNNDNVIMISPYTLLVSLETYLQRFLLSNELVEVQTKVLFYE